MSDLHPSARALIDAAKRGEGSLPSDARARVHRSVLRRAVALGTAVATTSTASAASKAAALVATLTSPLAIPGVVGAIAGVAFFVLRAGSAPAPQLPSAGPAAQTHAVAHIAPSVPNPLPSPLASADATPALVSSAFSGVAQEALVAVPIAAPSTVLPVSRAPLVAVRLPPATAAESRSATPSTAPGAQSAVEAIGSPAVTTTDESPRAFSGTTPAASGARTAPAPADLAEDLDLLRRVHAALRTGRSDAALSLLDRAGKGLEAGPLGEEAQVARVSALCQLGRIADARTATSRFLVAWPTSPLAVRLRGGCAALGTNAKPDAD